jgi:dimethylargininase
VPYAIVRAVARSFDRAITMAPLESPIDVDRAIAQHDAYVEALQELGLSIASVATDDDCPDCCFVEDVAVVAGGIALVTRPGAVSRRAEVEPVAAALAARMPIVRMEAPATAEGGDVLRVGRRLYVGRSARTNDAGIQRMAEVFGEGGHEVVGVDLPVGVLHLKSVCSALGEDVVLLAEGTIAPWVFAGARVLIVPAGEAHASNAVGYGGAAVIAAGCPRTAAMVEAAGVRVIPVDTGEIRKADGALTCMSIVVG